MNIKFVTGVAWVSERLIIGAFPNRIREALQSAEDFAREREEAAEALPGVECGYYKQRGEGADSAEVDAGWFVDDWVLKAGVGEDLQSVGAVEGQGG